MTDRMADRRSGNSIAPVGVALLLAFVLAAYVGSYAALVERKWDWAGSYEANAGYRYIDSSAARSFYWPVHEFDRHVRRDMWELEMFIY